jgi:hypothetical protein
MVVGIGSLRIRPELACVRSQAPPLILATHHATMVHLTIQAVDLLTSAAKIAAGDRFTHTQIRARRPLRSGPSKKEPAARAWRRSAPSQSQAYNAPEGAKKDYSNGCIASWENTRGDSRFDYRSLLCISNEWSRSVRILLERKSGRKNRLHAVHYGVRSGGSVACRTERQALPSWKSYWRRSGFGFC